MNRENGPKEVIFFKLFVLFGILAIIAGGGLSAFTAHQPTTFAMWASAYLVLVVGVAQVGFGWLSHTLVRRHRRLVAWVGFVVYNLGNIGVITGVALKHSVEGGVVFTDIGGGLLILAVLVLYYGVYGARWSWSSVVFYAVAVIIVVSVPIGLLLAD